LNAKNIVLLFPGQGSQEVGMGKSFLENSSSAQELFAQASNLLGRDLAKLCTEGPLDELTDTRWAQPAILTVSAIATTLLREKLPQLTISASAGHSLGEYTALWSAGSLSFPRVAWLVYRRGEFITSACAQSPGTMAAIVGLEDKAVEELCRQATKEAGLVEPANYNSPDQLVVTGVKAGVAKLIELAQQAGAKRAIELTVSGPFHSSMLKPAGEAMGKLLADEEVKPTAFPVYANVTAEPHRDPAQIIALLDRQMSSPVLFKQTLDKLAIPHTTFIELGQGKVLTGLVKRTLKGLEGMTTINIGNMEELEQAASALTSDIGNTNRP
jgi:[acyl-carrier-protein] S-malonyltransferase